AVCSREAEEILRYGHAGRQTEVKTHFPERQVVLLLASFGQLEVSEQVQRPLPPSEGTLQCAPVCEPQSASFWQPTESLDQSHDRGHSAAWPTSQPSAQYFPLPVSQQ